MTSEQAVARLIEALEVIQHRRVLPAARTSGLLHQLRGEAGVE
jgi:hypothetical protein